MAFNIGNDSETLTMKVPDKPVHDPAAPVLPPGLHVIDPQDLACTVSTQFVNPLLAGDFARSPNPP